VTTSLAAPPGARSECRAGRRPGRVTARRAGYCQQPMFFFSNRLGCGGSLLVSLVGTLLLLLILGVIDV
jgi:hypothetical protein